MKNRRSWLRALFLGVIISSGCAINPVSGRPELILLSTRGEQQLGEAQSKEVESAIGLVENEQLASWVNAIGQRLAKHSPRHDVGYQFQVVDSAEPNAFALPGGYVYVTRGLLTLVNSEDELAGVIAHEIGHVAARHSAQQVTRAAPFAILTNVGAAVTSIASPSLGRAVGGVGGLAAGIMLAPFSRDQEREADRVGQELSAAAGWDPAALPTILGSLERQQALAGNGGAGFLASHPSTPERVAATTAYAAQLQRTPGDPILGTRAGVLSRLDGLVVGPAAAQGVAAGPTFMHPDLGFFARFPESYDVTPSHRITLGAAKDDSGAILLAVVGEGEDPMDGPRALDQKSGTKIAESARPVNVPGHKAVGVRARMQTDSGEVVVAFAWIAHAGHIHQALGVAPIARAEAFLTAYDAFLESFRALTTAERAAIREEHLRVVPALKDETLGAFTARSKTPWKLERVALINEVREDALLSAGQLLKVSLPEPYASRAR